MEQQNFHPEIHYTNVKENREKDEDESFHSLDLVIEEKIIGKAEFVYFSKPFPLYQLSELYVDYEYQGKGLGSELMQQFEAFLKKKKKAGVLVDAIIEGNLAQGMYAKRGWQEVPGSPDLYAFNVPKSADISQLQGYAQRYTYVTDREAWMKKYSEGISQ